MTVTDDRNTATEGLIFEAATSVFHERGFAGARMQEIANRAGINHSMLHYYFRSKERLFDAVFRKAVLTLMPPVIEVLKSDLPLLDKLDAFVDRYLAMIRDNPHLPAFIIQELRRNPAALRDLVGEAASGVFGPVRDQVRNAVAEGRIRPVEPEHLIANVVALCVFPFMAQPMLETVFEMAPANYGAFLDGRAPAIKTFIRNALAP